MVTQSRQSPRVPSQARQSPRVLIIFATSHGHTAKVADAITSALVKTGTDATLRSVRDATDPLDAFDAVIVAAPVHAGDYGSELTDWVTRRARSLNAMPTAFVSVSLGVLQDDPKVRQDLDDIRERFLAKTGWKPTYFEPVAGALAYRQYNVVTRLMMKRIAAQAGGDTDTSRDHEYTDWAALDRFARGFVKRLAPAGKPSKQSVARQK